MSKAGLGFAILAAIAMSLEPITATAAESQTQMQTKSAGHDSFAVARDVTTHV